MTVLQTLRTLEFKKLSLHDEKTLQREIAALLPTFVREYRLSPNDVIDFFLLGVGIEVKIKGSRRQIYEQCKRYCQFSRVECLILVTNRTMGLPKEINGKHCYVVNLGKAWL